MSEGIDILFYDGECGLCHRTVSFVLNRGEKGECFRFAPLHGDSFQAHIPSALRTGLPDSVVIFSAGGAVLVRSQAVLHILHRLGGGWRALGWMGRILPRFVADGLYNFIARIRHRLFKKPQDVCPMMSPEQRKRFDH